MDRAATPTGAAVGTAVEFCGQFVGSPALGKKVIVAPMVGVDHVIRSQGMAYANRNGLLSRPEMSRRAHLLLLVTVGERFLRQSYLQQILMQGDEEVRPGHFCRHFLMVYCCH